MRYKMNPETEPITRLLFEKPESYAELGENARIAVDVMRDDGWKVQRIGMELDTVVLFKGVPMGADPDPNVELLMQSELRLAALRKEFVKKEISSWFNAGIAFVCCALMARLGTPSYLIAAPSVVNFGIAAYWLWRSRKGGA